MEHCGIKETFQTVADKCSKYPACSISSLFGNGQKHWATVAVSSRNIFDVALEIVDGEVTLDDREEMEALMSTLGQALAELITSIFDI